MRYLKQVLIGSTFCFGSMASYAQILDIDPQSVNAAAWVIYDPQSKQVIANHDAHVQRAPASLTKMMVAYLLFDAIKTGKLTLQQQLTVPKSVEGISALESQLKLKTGEKVSVNDLLAGLIVMSANDAALTVADALGQGNPQQFIALMNQTARKLGMHNTQFINASGITMNGHYSTAYDMAILSDAVIQHTPDYLNYAKLPLFKFKDTEYEATNLLLKRDNSVDGLKTGYTEAAGYNFALTANRLDPHTRQQRRLIVILLGSKSKQQRADIAQVLLNIAYTYTQNQHSLKKSQKIARIPIQNGQYQYFPLHWNSEQSLQTLSLLPQAQRLDLNKFDLQKQRFILNQKPLSLLEPSPKPQQVEYAVQLHKNTLNAPIQQSTQHLATLQIKQFGQVIHEQKLSYPVRLHSETWLQRMWAKVQSLWQSPSPSKAETYPIQP